VSEDDLAAVLDLVAGTDVAELELTIGASRVTLRRSPHLVARADGTGRATTAPLEPRSLAIASPLVGVFHPAVGVGERVTHGQVIGAIEALGMPTNVDAPQAGTVEDVLASDGSPVEYGQPLLLLRRAIG
jgi:biotin carboxyl carrier protein